MCVCVCVCVCITRLESKGYSHHQTTYNDTWVGLRTYQHPRISVSNWIYDHPDDDL